MIEKHEVYWQSASECEPANADQQSSTLLQDM